MSTFLAVFLGTCAANLIFIGIYMTVSFFSNRTVRKALSRIEAQEKRRSEIVEALKKAVAQQEDAKRRRFDN